MIETTHESHDPLPGDFDDELAAVDPHRVQILEGSADARVSIQLIIHGEDAARLERIAQARGRDHGELIAELLREAELHADQRRR